MCIDKRMSDILILHARRMGRNKVTLFYIYILRSM